MKDIQKQVAMKEEVGMAIIAFQAKYPKIPKGIKKIYADMRLTNDINEITKLYKKFFGYLKKSKNAKEKFSYIDQE